ncbi:tyrosinase-like protein [Dendronephthya gigantea]|uniref:tyrosinase-like protein n=1 Tax=Dendronephthya gigantea TaxID=151771 RepID=UPI001069053E|nr:tyrosinase-like protein [Dendronephthya gigantea]
MLRICVVLVFAIFEAVNADGGCCSECNTTPLKVPNIKTTCTESCRVRKEFTHMTTNEKCAYIDAIKRVSTEEPYKTKYKNLLCIHKKYFPHIHGDHPNYFFPWHRWFILQYENLLREVDCSVTVPYWDWTTDANGRKWYDSSVWDIYSGLGGDGSKDDDNVVVDGPFKSPDWPMVPDNEDCNEHPVLLKRNFNESGSYSAIHIQLSLQIPSFPQFSNTAEATYHDNMHDFIGEIMGSRRSAFAPEFFLHHGFIDKIWSDWEKNETRVNDMMKYFQCNDNELVGTLGMNASNFLNLTNLPGDICVRYEDYNDSPMSLLQGLTLEQLRNIPFVPPPPISQHGIKLFLLPKSMVHEVERIMDNLGPLCVIPPGMTSRKIMKMGFNVDDIQRVRVGKSCALHHVRSKNEKKNERIQSSEFMRFFNVRE